MSDTEPQTISDIFDNIREQPEEGAARFAAEFDMGGVDINDTSEESRLLREQGRDAGIHIPERPEKSDLPLNNPLIAVDPTRSVREDIENSFKAEFDFGEVEVSHEERARYLRCALHDTEVWFDVTLEGLGMTIRVAIPTEGFTTTVMTALSKWAEAGAIDSKSDMQWLLAFQQLHAWYSVRQVDGKLTPWAEEFENDKPPRGKTLRTFLYDAGNFEFMSEMGAPRWRAIAVAMRIAEARYKVCNDALRDRSFFTGADTA